MPQPSCTPELRQNLDGAAQLVTRLRESCEALRSHADDESTWLESFATASRLKVELEDKLKALEVLDERVGRAAARRKERRRRAKQQRDLDEREREQRRLQAEAGIDAWRLQKIRQVEDKKRVSHRL